MPHDRSDWRKEVEMTPKQRQQEAQAHAQKEHEKALRRDVKNLVDGIRGEREPHPGEFQKSADRLAALQQGGDALLEQILVELGDTASRVRDLLEKPETQLGDGETLHTVEYQEDGTMLITNPSARVIIVSLELRQHSSARETIRLAPGETVEIKPEITSHAQTWEEWSEEGEPARRKDFQRWLGNLRIVGE